MSTKARIAVIWLLSVALVAAFTPVPFAEARGGGGGGHGGGGGGFGGGHGGGFGGGGGHFGGGGFSGGHVGGGGWGGGHVGGWSGGHVGGWSGGHVGGWSGGHAFAGQQFSHGAAGIASPNRGNIQSFAGRSGTWNHAGTWNRAFAGNGGVWNHGQGWWNHHEPDRDDFFGFGIYGWPWYAFDWGAGNWWPNYYDYGYAPYGDLYGNYYDYAAAPYASYTPASTVIETGPPEVGSEASDYYSQALAAFRQGDYGNAARLAGHAAIDDPRNPDVHALAMLGLFAMGEYRGAAMEAHAVAAMGHIPDWPTLYGFYENVTPYTEQLRKLEKFVDEHPSAAEGRFLLGFQYLMEGHKDAAKKQLTEAVRLTPQDTLAAKLLEQEGGKAPVNNLPPPSPPATTQPQASAMGTGSLR